MHRPAQAREYLLQQGPPNNGLQARSSTQGMAVANLIIRHHSLLPSCPIVAVPCTGQALLPGIKAQSLLEQCVIEEAAQDKVQQ